MGGAKASRHFSMCSVCQAIQQIIAVWRVAHTISAPHHACACRPHIHAYLLPSSSLGPHSRRPSLASAVQHVTTCRACGSGALRRPAFSFLDISRLFRAAVASLLPWSARTHPDQLEPWSARTHHLPLRRLAPVSRSVGLSPTLSLPFSLALPFSFSPVALLCSFPTVLYPLSLSLSLFLSPSLSLKQWGGGRTRQPTSFYGTSPCALESWDGPRRAVRWAVCCTSCLNRLAFKRGGGDAVARIGKKCRKMHEKCGKCGKKKAIENAVL